MDKKDLDGGLIILINRIKKKFSLIKYLQFIDFREAFLMLDRGINLVISLCAHILC